MPRRLAPRTAWRWVSEKARAAVGSFVARARQQSRRSRVAWLVVAIVVVAGPVLITLNRDRRFSARVEIFPAKSGPYPAPRAPAYYRRLLEEPQVVQAAFVQAGLRVDSELIGEAHVDRSPDRNAETLILTAQANTPERARELTNALVDQTAAATSRQVGALAKAEVKNLQRKLDSPSATGAKRTELSAGIKRIKKLRSNAPPRFFAGPRPASPEPTRWGDKLVDALPGGFTPRPSPIWVGLAGLLAVSVLWLVWLGRRPIVPPAESQQGTPRRMAESPAGQEPGEH